MKNILLVTVTMLLLILLVGCSEKNNQPPKNNVAIGNQHDEVVTTYIEGEIKLEPLTFTNIKIIQISENKNLLIATVVNNSSGDILSKVLDIELYGNDNVSFGVVGAILPEISKDGSATLEVPISLNVMDTKNIEIRYTVE